MADTTPSTKESSLLPINMCEMVYNMRLDNGVIDYQDYNRYKAYLKKRYTKSKKMNKNIPNSDLVGLVYRLELIYVKHRMLKNKYKVTNNAKTRHNLLYKLRKCYLTIEKLYDRPNYDNNTYDYTGLEMLYKGEYYYELNDYLKSFQFFIILLGEKTPGGCSKLEDFIKEEFINILVYNINLLNDQGVSIDQLEDKTKESIINNYKTKYYVKLITKEKESKAGDLVLCGEKIQIFDMGLYNDLKDLEEKNGRVDYEYYEKLRNNIITTQTKSITYYIDYHVTRRKALEIYNNVKAILHQFENNPKQKSDQAMLSESLIRVNKLHNEMSTSPNQNTKDYSTYENGFLRLKKSVYTILVVLTTLHYYAILDKASEGSYRSVLKLCERAQKEIQEINGIQDDANKLLEEKDAKQLERLIEIITLETTVELNCYRIAMNRRLLQSLYTDKIDSKNSFINIREYHDYSQHLKNKQNLKRNPVFEMLDTIPIVFDVVSNIVDMSTEQDNIFMRYISEKLNLSQPPASSGLKGIIKSFFG